jgi:alpha,alpha-trehalose phosphorylase
VIYRFQVLKQADVVLALFLQGNRFTAEEKRRDFEYYDPITTGDSTLSAVVQSVIAAEVGYRDAALRYFLNALYVDLQDLHGNTVDGIHVASAGGVWGALVFGFAGLRDTGGRLSFDPRLPESWPSLRFPLAWHGVRLRVELDATSLSVAMQEAEDRCATEISVWVRDEHHVLSPGSPIRVELDARGPRLDGEVGEEPVLGGTRADGTTITAGVPDPIQYDDPWERPDLSTSEPPFDAHVPQS